MKLKGNNLAIAMAKQCVNFTELAELSNVSRATLSYINNGKTCKPDVAGKIAKALNVDVNDIFDSD